MLCRDVRLSRRREVEKERLMNKVRDVLRRSEPKENKCERECGKIGRCDGAAVLHSNGEEVCAPLSSV